MYLTLSDGLVTCFEISPDTLTMPDNLHAALPLGLVGAILNFDLAMANLGLISINNGGEGGDWFGFASSLRDYPPDAPSPVAKAPSVEQVLIPDMLCMYLVELRPMAEKEGISSNTLQSTVYEGLLRLSQLSCAGDL